MRFFKSAILLPALCCLALAACSKDSTESPRAEQAGGERDLGLSAEERARQPEFGGVLTFLLRRNPKTLNNAIRTDSYSRRICNFLFPSLLDFDPRTGAVRPMTVAALPEASADRLVYTWRLRPGIKWHDYETSGVHVTTRDVKASLDMIGNPAVKAAGIRKNFGGLKEIRVKDELTFETVFDRARFNSWYVFGRNFRIMPAHLIQSIEPADFNGHPLGRDPVGYGPFRLHHWDEGREILLQRFDPNREIFPEGVRPWVDGLRWKIVADNTMEFRLFMRGEIDIFNLTHVDLALKTDDERFHGMATLHSYYLPWYSYMAWNNRSVFFEDTRVRRAMAHLMRREQILEKHLQGLGKVPSGPFFYYSSGYDRSIEPLAYDPDKASELLAAAGWADSDGNGILDRDVGGELREFRFELLLSSHPQPYESALYRLMVEDLKSEGIVMELRPLEFRTRLDLIEEQRFDAFVLANSLDPVYEDFSVLWHSSQAFVKGGNRVGFSDPRADEILETVGTEFDDGRRNGLLKELHAILHAQQPVTALFTPSVNAVINRRWRGVHVYEGRGVDIYEWWLPREKHGATDVIPPRGEDK